MRPPDAALTRDYLRDLAVAIRCARRDGQARYAEDNVREFRRLWPARHTATISRYGIPGSGSV